MACCYELYWQYIIYVQKINYMIEKGIQQGKYTKTEDSTYIDLKLLQDFIYRYIKDSKSFDKMHSVYNQPNHLFATVKTHRFSSINWITLEDSKLFPIIDLTRTYTYNSSKVIANFLKPSAKKINIPSQICQNFLHSWKVQTLMIDW